MKKTSSPIVFFGSGPVAAKSLTFLAEHCSVEAVVTKPRPPHHRGIVPVLDVAKKHNLPVCTAQNKAELDTLIAAKPFASKLGVLIDFGIIVSQKVIDYFPLGIINSHFSLLPALRGADPITFAILNGEPRTGVSLMLLVEAMDEGPLLAQSMYELPPDITTPELTEKLIEISDAALQQIIPLYIAGEIQPIPQANEGATYSRRLTKQDGLIDWRKPATTLEREIRAFADWPKSHATLGDKEVIITKAHMAPANSADHTPGYIDQSLLDDGILMVETGDGRLCIDMLKPANKKEMPSRAFLAGYKELLLKR